MKIVVTGGAGQLGRAIACQKTSHQILYTDLPEMDITDGEAVRSFFLTQRPEVIIHAAAYTHVDKAEQLPQEAFRVNVEGTKKVAEAAAESGAALLYVSTDYVFDGTAAVPYREEMPIAPVNVYGMTKAGGEALVRQLVPRHYVVRTAWLYGEGQNFVRRILQLAEEQETLSVVHDQRGSPTSADELAQALLALVETEAYGTYHGTCQGETSWYELACAVLRLRGLSRRVLPVTTAESARPARRPAYSALDSRKLYQTLGKPLLPWEEALRGYLCGEEGYE